MKRLSRKESMAIATIHDALREFRLKDMNAYVEMRCNSISISFYPDTVKEANKIMKQLCFFKDVDDEIHTKHYEASGDCDEFYKIQLKKYFV